MSADSNLRKANLFNDYFISVFTRNTLDVQLGESDSKLPDGRVASDYQINRDVVYNVLSLIWTYPGVVVKTNFHQCSCAN